jgi:hypothetical protein
VEEETVRVKTNTEPRGSDEENEALTATDNNQPVESARANINSGQVDDFVGRLREQPQEGTTPETLLPSSKKVEEPSNCRDDPTFRKWKPSPPEMEETKVGGATVTKMLTGTEVEIPSVANIVTR